MTRAESGETVEDRYEAARAVLRELGIDESWKAVVDPGMPAWLHELTLEMLDAYERLDLDWMVAHCHPEIVISQPAEFPEARTYRGREAFIDSLLDWPRDWENFRIEPCRIFAWGDDQLLLDAVHHGTSRAVGLELEAQIVFVLRWVDGLVDRWLMFLSMDEALLAADRPH